MFSVRTDGGRYWVACVDCGALWSGPHVHDVAADVVAEFMNTEAGYRPPFALRSAPCCGTDPLDPLADDPVVLGLLADMARLDVAMARHAAGSADVARLDDVADVAARYVAAHGQVRGRHRASAEATGQAIGYAVGATAWVAGRCVVGAARLVWAVGRLVLRSPLAALRLVALPGCALVAGMALVRRLGGAEGLVAAGSGAARGALMMAGAVAVAYVLAKAAGQLATSKARQARIDQTRRAAFAAARAQRERDGAHY